MPGITCPENREAVPQNGKLFHHSSLSMTLQDFFNLLADNPAYIIMFFTLIPITALLAAFMGKGEGHLSPWRYLYSVLIYLVCVPAIFSITLSAYLFLFERRSILQTDVYTQILPILSMVLTLWLIRKNVDLEYIPGFDKLSGLIMMIVAALGIMWFIDRTRIFAFTYIPFPYVLLIFVGLLLVIRLGWGRLVSRS